MTDAQPNETEQPEPQDTPVENDELISVVDRSGRKKMIPRSEYERKKRRRKKREHRSTVSFKNVLSVAFILAAMIAAAYVALKIVE